jgi:5'-nucleotidase
MEEREIIIPDFTKEYHFYNQNPSKSNRFIRLSESKEPDLNYAWSGQSRYNHWSGVQLYISWYSATRGCSSMQKQLYRILLTNDDGIDSPGLLAAAEALSRLGEVIVVAPRHQQTSAGRSFSRNADGMIEERLLKVNGRTILGYAVGATPAQVVLHALQEVLPDAPDLAVSGINYGENVGNSITISGTMGAAFELASAGIPTLAASLQLPAETANYLDHDQSINFSAAAHFVAFFGRYVLEQGLPEGVDILKLEVPFHATPDTAWRVTRLSRLRGYEVQVERHGGWDTPGRTDGVPMRLVPGQAEPDSDIHVLRLDGLVSVTPLNIDMTARIDLQAFDRAMRKRA